MNDVLKIAALIKNNFLICKRFNKIKVFKNKPILFKNCLKSRPTCVHGAVSKIRTEEIRNKMFLSAEARAKAPEPPTPRAPARRRPAPV